MKKMQQVCYLVYVFIPKFTNLSPHSARKVIPKVFVNTRNILTHFLPNQDFSLFSFLSVMSGFGSGWMLSVLRFCDSSSPSSVLGPAFSDSLSRRTMLQLKILTINLDLKHIHWFIIGKTVFFSSLLYLQEDEINISSCSISVLATCSFPSVISCVVNNLTWWLKVQVYSNIVKICKPYMDLKNTTIHKRSRFCLYVSFNLYYFLTLFIIFIVMFPFTCSCTI